jgi:hypothetical protein
MVVVFLPLFTERRRISLLGSQRDASVLRILRTPRTQVASIRRYTHAVSNQHVKPFVEHLLIATPFALCCLGVILPDNNYVA